MHATMNVFRLTLCLALFVLYLGGLAPCAAAQGAARSSKIVRTSETTWTSEMTRTSEAMRTAEVAWRQATLAGWEDRLHLALRDRRHAYGGLFFDRGLLRRLTPEMDHEYDLDVQTFAFTLQEDAAWYRAPYGFRTYMGSVSTSRFATVSHLRATVPVRERHQVHLSGIQQEDLQAQRFFVELGYAYQLGGAHRLGFTQTVAAYKPDLDFGLFYAYDDADRGQVRFGVTFLDVANNFIFDRLGVDPVLEDTTRSYRRRPRLFALSLASPPLGRFRAELVAGIQPPARALVASQAEPANRFFFSDAASYLGGLAEYRLARITLGTVYRQTRTAIARRPDASSDVSGALTSDYASRQQHREATLYVLAEVWRLRGEAWLARVRYTDRQQGTDFDEARIPAPLDFEERRLTAHVRLRYVPAERGVLAGGAYLAIGRRFPSGRDLMLRYLRFAPQPPHHRLSLHAGYRFTPHAHVVVGANVDLDGDAFYGDGRGLTRYDGGFAQIVVRW